MEVRVESSRLLHRLRRRGWSFGELGRVKIGDLLELGICEMLG